MNVILSLYVCVLCLYKSLFSVKYFNSFLCGSAFTYLSSHFSFRICVSLRITPRKHVATHLFSLDKMSKVAKCVLFHPDPTSTNTMCQSVVLLSTYNCHVLVSCFAVILQMVAIFCMCGYVFVCVICVCFSNSLPSVKTEHVYTYVSYVSYFVSPSKWLWL